MKKFLVTVETTGGQLETVDGNWLDYDGECVIGSFHANTKEEAEQLGRERLANESDDRLMGQNYCMNAYELPSEQFLYTFLSETSGAGVTLQTMVFDDYDKAIEQQIIDEKAICEQCDIDHHSASQMDSVHGEDVDWTYDSSEEDGFSKLHVQVYEDCYNIDIRLIKIGENIIL